MPSIFLMRILALSAQPGFNFLLFGIPTSFLNLILLVYPSLNASYIGDLPHV
jgi:hypothetical protein